MEIILEGKEEHPQQQSAVTEVVDIDVDADALTGKILLARKVRHQS